MADGFQSASRAEGHGSGWGSGEHIVQSLIDRFGLESIAILGGEPGHCPYPGNTVLTDTGSALALFRTGARFDLVYLPPAASPEQASHAMSCGLRLLTGRGSLVVEGCLPSTVGPNTMCEAFVDFAVVRKGISYITLDCDVGYGLLAPNYRFNPFFTDLAAPSVELDWELLAGQDRHDLLRDHANLLLRIVPWNRFQEIMDDFETFSS